MVEERERVQQKKKGVRPSLPADMETRELGVAVRQQSLQQQIIMVLWLMLMINLTIFFVSMAALFSTKVGRNFVEDDGDASLFVYYYD